VRNDGLLVQTKIQEGITGNMEAINYKHPPSVHKKTKEGIDSWHQLKAIQANSNPGFPSPEGVQVEKSKPCTHLSFHWSFFEMYVGLLSYW